MYDVPFDYETLQNYRRHNMANSDKVRGYISLWRNHSDNEQAPIFKGTLDVTPELFDALTEAFMNREDDSKPVKLSVSVWNNDSDNQNAPQGRGVVEPIVPKSNEDKKESSGGGKRRFESKTQRAKRMI